MTRAPCACTRSTRCAVEAVEAERDEALANARDLTDALKDLVDYTDPEKDASILSAGARVERARALLERLGAI